MELIVGRQSYKTTPCCRQREEYLCSSILPHLELKWKRERNKDRQRILEDNILNIVLSNIINKNTPFPLLPWHHWVFPIWVLWSKGSQNRLRVEWPLGSTGWPTPHRGTWQWNTPPENKVHVHHNYNMFVKYKKTFTDQTSESKTYIQYVFFLQA